MMFTCTRDVLCSRLEPLPRDSCDSLAADTSSSSIKAGDGSLERLTSKARVHPMDSINKGNTAVVVIAVGVVVIAEVVLEVVGVEIIAILAVVVIVVCY